MEELYFRGCLSYVFDQFIKNNIIKYILISIFFLGVHPELRPDNSRIIFLLSIIFTYLYYKTKTIWLSVFVHLLWNFKLNYPIFIFKNVSLDQLSIIFIGAAALLILIDKKWNILSYKILRAKEPCIKS